MPTEHTLPALPANVHWGYFDAALPPVIVVEPGDRVRILTVSGQPRDLVGSPFALLPDHAEILRTCTPKLGPHILTGPVGIRGAEPGDVLEVRVLDIQLRQDWGWNAQRPLRGSLPEDFPSMRLLHIPIDRARGTAQLPFGIELALRPFFGIMAVAPPPAYGALSTIEPREFGGNIDNQEFVPGTSVFFPVFTPLALFSTGDGHAVQGDGEVNLTALETALEGHFEFHLHKAAALAQPVSMPVACTPTHLITMGFHEDLDDAAKQALREMIRVLVRVKGWQPADAYAFCSMACDLHVTQLVDGNKGVHAMVSRRHVDEAALRSGLGLAAPQPPSEPQDPR